MSIPGISTYHGIEKIEQTIDFLAWCLRRSKFNSKDDYFFFFFGLMMFNVYNANE